MVTPLMAAACEGQSECAEVLLKAGANVNQCDNNGDTALIAATLREQS